MLSRHCFEANRSSFRLTDSSTVYGRKADLRIYGKSSCSCYFSYCKLTLKKASFYLAKQLKFFLKKCIHALGARLTHTLNAHALHARLSRTPLTHGIPCTQSKHSTTIGNTDGTWHTTPLKQYPNITPQPVVNCNF